MNSLKTCMIMKILIVAHLSKHPYNHNWIQNDHPTSYIHYLHQNHNNKLKQAQVDSFLYQTHMIKLRDGNGVGIPRTRQGPAPKRGKFPAPVGERGGGGGGGKFPRPRPRFPVGLKSPFFSPFPASL